MAKSQTDVLFERLRANGLRKRFCTQRRKTPLHLRPGLRWARLQLTRHLPAARERPVVAGQQQRPLGSVVQDALARAARRVACDARRCGGLVVDPASFLQKLVFPPGGSR